MRLLTMSLLVSAGFCSAAAAAESDWYATAKIAFNAMDDQSIEYSNAGNTTSASAEFDGGFALGATAGYRFNDRWRLEGEFMYRTSELDRVDIPGLGSFTDGDYSSAAIGLNGLYDFNLFGSERIRTYAGAGVAWLQEIDIDFEQAGIEQSYSSDDFGFQVMLGARYDLGENWFFESDIRYFIASDIDMSAEGNAVGSVVADYEPLSLSLGIGWRF